MYDPATSASQASISAAFASLTDAEFQALDHFLLYEVDSDESMTIALLDGFPHAIAIGPTTILPQQWLPKVWGMDSFMPPMASIEQVNHVMGLIMCFYNSIVAGFQTDPPDVTPVWTTHAYWLPYRQAVHERAMAKAM